MTDLNTNGLYAVEVPEGHSAEGFYFVHSTSSFGSWELYPQFGGQAKPFVRNTYKEPKIIGLFNELSSEQCKGLVELHTDGVFAKEPTYYKLYRQKVYVMGSAVATTDAKESLQSLLESKCLNPSTQNILLIQKVQH